MGGQKVSGSNRSDIIMKNRDYWKEVQETRCLECGLSLGVHHEYCPYFEADPVEEIESEDPKPEARDWGPF